MGEPTWKVAERRLAKLFGTERRALSGGISKSGGRDDSMHEDLFISSKYSSQDSFPVFSLYKEELPKAIHEDKTLVIGFSRRRFPGQLLLIHSNDLETVALTFLRQLGYNITQ